MSLKTFTENLGNGIANRVNQAVTHAKSAIGNIIGTAKASFTSIWDGGFAGISEQGIEELKNALKQYCAAIEDHIASFNTAVPTEGAFAGPIRDASVDYLESIKDLLKAYVSTMKVNLDDLDAAFAAYMKQSNELAANIRSDAESIRSQAAQIKLD